MKYGKGYKAALTYLHVAEELVLVQLDVVPRLELQQLEEHPARGAAGDGAGVANRVEGHLAGPVVGHVPAEHVEHLDRVLVPLGRARNQLVPLALSGIDILFVVVFLLQLVHKVVDESERQGREPTAFRATFKV